MPSIKELRSKIKSLRNTSKITSAMKLVSSSKLKKAQDAWSRNKPYLTTLQEVVDRLLQSASTAGLDLLKPPAKVKRVKVILVSTDKGLCGSFNSNLLKAVQVKVKGDWADAQVEVVSLGKKGADFFARRCPVSKVNHLPGLPIRIPFSLAQAQCNDAITDFLAGKADVVYLAYNNFISMLTQQPTVKQLLPIVLPEKKKGPALDYSFEPEDSEILKKIFPQLIQASIYNAMLSNALGEQAARMNAMDNATRNSKDLINRYTLSMNRARQSAITTELSEIVAGAESLKT